MLSTLRDAQSLFSEMLQKVTPPNNGQLKKPVFLFWKNMLDSSLAFFGYPAKKDDDLRDEIEIKSYSIMGFPQWVVLY